MTGPGHCTVLRSPVSMRLTGGRRCATIDALRVSLTTPLPAPPANTHALLMDTLSFRYVDSLLATVVTAGTEGSWPLWAD